MNKVMDQESYEKKISNKELILRKAYGLFLKKGYQSVSIKDIMEASNLSKGGIYHHFENKEGILSEVLDRYFFKTLSIDKSLFEGLPFKDRIKMIYKLGVGLFAMVESMGKNGIKYPVQRLFHFQLECENFPEMRKEFRNTSIAYAKIVQDIVYEGIQNGEVKPELDAEILSYQIIGMIEGIAIHNSTVKQDIENMLMEKYEKVFNSYFNFICPN
ncbi:TetR/AcrR family transcriptional regulator [Gelidibacter sp.]|uniref:TetR/AcrR family transcriptional regulator n=1 Tax=Gelidibacter sp. TaxID=2018083 RepID=UPI002B978E25|nr:TetR/AcrR family transcriptional regulator [Gelidibacter sp.]HUH27745.1 TetR/AcrR family transcriptional regulator [Gelidibacter sp.]